MHLLTLQRSSQREKNAQSRVKVGDICHSQDSPRMGQVWRPGHICHRTTAQGQDRAGDLVGLPANIVTVLVILEKHEPP